MKVFLRILKYPCLAGLLLGLLVLGINLYVVNKASGHILAPEALEGEKADCILVLGALVWEDGRPSQVLMDRLDTAIALYNAGVSDRLLMSGDHGSVDYDEVGSMKQYAMEQGVPEEAIFMDHAGFSTYESMYRAQAIFEVKTCVAVTQSYHLYRAVYLGNSLGIETRGVSADRRTYKRQLWYDVREALARVKDVVFVIFKPEPTYLGEAIPISGDSSASDFASFRLAAAKK